MLSMIARAPSSILVSIGYRSCISFFAFLIGLQVALASPPKAIGPPLDLLNNFLLVPGPVDGQEATLEYVVYNSKMIFSPQTQYLSNK